MMSFKHRNEFENIIKRKLSLDNIIDFERMRKNIIGGNNLKLRDRETLNKINEDNLKMLFTTKDEDTNFDNSFYNFKYELLANLYVIPLKESITIYINSHIDFLVYFYKRICFYEGLYDYEVDELSEKYNMPKEHSMGKIPSLFREYFEFIKDICLSYNIDFEAQCRKYNNDENLKHDFIVDFKFNETAKIDFLNNEVNEQFNDKFTKGQMLYLLEKIGIKETNLIKGATISQTAKYELLSQIVSLNTRDVKKFLNDGIQEICSPNKIIEVDKYFNKITKSKSN